MRGGVHPGAGRFGVPRAVLKIDCRLYGFKIEYAGGSLIIIIIGLPPVHVPACTVLYCRAQRKRERERKGGGGEKIHVTAPRRSPRRGPAETAPRRRFEIKDQGTGAVRP